jgi:hypothetical protein
MTSTSSTQQLSTLRTRLFNLADDIDYRLTSNDTTSWATLLDKLLDRLVDLARSVSDEVLCIRCPNPAIYDVEAGQPGTVNYRAEIVCAACLRVSKQWAGVKGPVRTRLLTSDERRINP